MLQTDSNGHIEYMNQRMETGRETLFQGGNKCLLRAYQSIQKRSLSALLTHMLCIHPAQAQVQCQIFLSDSHFVFIQAFYTHMNNFILRKDREACEWLVDELSMVSGLPWSPIKAHIWEQSMREGSVLLLQLTRLEKLNHLMNSFSATN